MASPGRSTLPPFHPSTLLVRLHPHARAHEVPVPPGAVDAADGGPDLVLARGGGREGGALAGVRPVPCVGRDLGEGVRRAGEEVALAVGRAALDLADLLPDRDHRVAEAVELLLRLALSRLDHERTGHREGDRRRVEAEIDDPLRDVLHLDARAALEWPRVHDALVGDEAVRATVEEAVVALEALRDVVRIEDRDLRRLGESLGAHE